MARTLGGIVVRVREGVNNSKAWSKGEIGVRGKGRGLEGWNGVYIVSVHSGISVFIVWDRRRW